MPTSTSDADDPLITTRSQLELCHCHFEALISYTHCVLEHSRMKTSSEILSQRDMIQLSRVSKKEIQKISQGRFSRTLNSMSDSSLKNVIEAWQLQLAAVEDHYEILESYLVRSSKELEPLFSYLEHLRKLSKKIKTKWGKDLKRIDILDQERARSKKKCEKIREEYIRVPRDFPAIDSLGRQLRAAEGSYRLVMNDYKQKLGKFIQERIPKIMSLYKQGFNALQILLLDSMNKVHNSNVSNEQMLSWLRAEDGNTRDKLCGYIRDLEQLTEGCNMKAPSPEYYELLVDYLALQEVAKGEDEENKD